MNDPVAGLDAVSLAFKATSASRSTPANGAVRPRRLPLLATFDRGSASPTSPPASVTMPHVTNAISWHARPAFTESRDYGAVALRIAARTASAARICASLKLHAQRWPRASRCVGPSMVSRFSSHT